MYCVYSLSVGNTQTMTSTHFLWSVGVEGVRKRIIKMVRVVVPSGVISRLIAIISVCIEEVGAGLILYYSLLDNGVLYYMCRYLIQPIYVCSCTHMCMPVHTRTHTHTHTQ